MKTNKTKPRVVIVGGGFGGLALAKQLKHAPVEIILLDRHNYHTFQPLLYQVATGALEAETITFPFRRVFQDQDNFSFALTEVRTIHQDRNVIETAIGEISTTILYWQPGPTQIFLAISSLNIFRWE